MANQYAEILINAIRSKPNWQTATEVPFDQTDLRTAAARLGHTVRNFPDLTYSLRSRQQIPEELQRTGFQAIEMRGRGKFALTRQRDDPETGNPPSIVVDGRKVPDLVRDLVRADEQGLLSIVLYLELIRQFLKTDALRLQGHLRTAGEDGQQIEVGEVYIATSGKKGR